MFTLKLYANSRTRIVEAQSFTVYWYDHLVSCQITAHQKDASADQAFYVGDNAKAADAVAHSELWYDRAIVENSNGRTTEMIQPIPSGPQTVAQSGKHLAA